jgi:hypothetical protein
VQQAKVALAKAKALLMMVAKNVVMASMGWVERDASYALQAK